MVKAGPSTYYSDAIVKHFSPVSLVLPLESFIG